jgi:hypothetical protein
MTNHPENGWLVGPVLMASTFSVSMLGLGSS